jgi:hypothetical protein
MLWRPGDILTLNLDHKMSYLVYLDHKMSYLVYLDHKMSYLDYLDHKISYLVYLDHKISYLVYLDHKMSYLVYLNFFHFLLKIEKNLNSKLTKYDFLNAFIWHNFHKGSFILN